MTGPLALAVPDPVLVGLIFLSLALSIGGMFLVICLARIVERLAIIVADIVAEIDPPPAMPHAAEAPAARDRLHAVGEEP